MTVATDRRETADQDDDDKLSIKFSQVAGGALAALTAGVLGSWFGVTGTLIGTALASVIGTVSSTLYAYSLKRTSSRLATIRPGAVPLRRPTLRWRSVLGVAGLVFVLAMGAITAIELAQGRTVSAAVRGESSGSTSIGVVGRAVTGGAVAQSAPAPTRTPTATPSRSSEPTGSTRPASPTPGRLSPSPTQAVERSASPAPKASPSPTLTATPTAAPDGRRAAPQPSTS